MSSGEDVLERWHADEENWWNLYGEYMNYQWKLSPKMNRYVRTELDQDYRNYLLRPGETLLDIGCGSGWLSMDFAAQGMTVLGIDLSREQINIANRLKDERKLGNVRFECSDFMKWDVANLKGCYENVFVSAFLHHLPEVELELIIRKIAAVLKPGGRVYMYEPLRIAGERPFMVKVVDRVCNALLQVMLDRLPAWFGWWTERHRAEIRRGYKMCSPHEGPVSVELVRRFCGNELEILETRGWHLNSLGFAMQVMGLKDVIRKSYEPIVAFWYWLDKLLLRWFGWEAFSMPQRFILCSIKLVRK